MTNKKQWQGNKFIIQIIWDFHIKQDIVEIQILSYLKYLLRGIQTLNPKDLQKIQTWKDLTRNKIIKRSLFLIENQDPKTTRVQL